METISLTQPTFDELRSVFAANPAAAPAPAPIAAPAPSAPTPAAASSAVNPQLAAFVATYPGTAFLMDYNAVAAPGTAGTITLAETGHVLSVPYPTLEGGIGETFTGYFLRTSLQTGIGPATAAADLGSLNVLMSGTYNVGNWPKMADEIAWRLAGVPGVNPYAPASSSTGTQAAPTSSGGTGPLNWESGTDNDKAYALATFVRRQGTNVPVAMDAAFNNDGQWSNWKENNEPLVASMNLATYTGQWFNKL